jgi:1,4-alpha-glucan branching enzyme
VPGALFSHAHHFAAVVKDMLRRHRDRCGREGVVVAPFDAELFGHWWHEGPDFLAEVLATLGADPDVQVTTPSEWLAARPADKVAWMPEGSWGDGGDHRVWLNDRNRWTWEVLHRAEERFGAMCLSLPWKKKAGVREALTRAGRELLLMQASDWQFVVTTGGAPDYGLKRFAGHATRFDRMCDLAWDRSRGARSDEVQKVELADVDAHDDVFEDLRLEDWA